jgi:hypothetical protein
VSAAGQASSGTHTANSKFDAALAASSHLRFCRRSYSDAVFPIGEGTIDACELAFRMERIHPDSTEAFWYRRFFRITMEQAKSMSHSWGLGDAM